MRYGKRQGTALPHVRAYQRPDTDDAEAGMGHTRRGYQVREHSRQVSGRVVADVLARDLDRVYEEIDEDRAPERIIGADPDCPHPGWYPIRRHLLDVPYEESPTLAYCCTGCAGSAGTINRKET